MITAHEKRIESILNIPNLNSLENFDNIFKNRTFKMSEMIVSWKYVQIIDNG